jgi:hypothetical protein
MAAEWQWRFNNCTRNWCPFYFRRIAVPANTQQKLRRSASLLESAAGHDAPAELRLWGSSSRLSSGGSRDAGDRKRLGRGRFELCGQPRDFAFYTQNIFMTNGFAYSFVKSANALIEGCPIEQTLIRKYRKIVQIPQQPYSAGAHTAEQAVAHNLRVARTGYAKFEMRLLANRIPSSERPPAQLALYTN